VDTKTIVFKKLTIEEKQKITGGTIILTPGASFNPGEDDSHIVRPYPECVYEPYL